MFFSSVLSDLFESLGITLTGVLFHSMNAVILIIALTLLLYKPMKKMIAQNRKKLQDSADDAQRLSSEATEAKAKYETMLVSAKDETLNASRLAAEKAAIHADEIIKAAQEKADNIIKSAKQEVRAERARQQIEFKESVAKKSVEIAEKILEREVSSKDNNALIDDCLKEWS